MYPNAKAVARLHFVAPDGRTEDYGALYYARDRNQKIIVRMTAPPTEVGNDLLMIEQNVWAYERRINRVTEDPVEPGLRGHRVLLRRRGSAELFRQLHLHPEDGRR